MSLCVAVEVSRKHKKLMAEWRSFSASIGNALSRTKQSLDAQSLVSSMDCIGRESKCFTDTVMKCVWSFVEDYLLTSHEVNFCYLSLGILGRLYSVYRSRLHRMAAVRKMLFLALHREANSKEYLCIYWNDFSSFKWPHSVQQCVCSISASANGMWPDRGALDFSQFGADTIDSKEMDVLIQRLHSRCFDSPQITESVEDTVNTRTRSENGKNLIGAVLGKRKSENDNVRESAPRKKRKREGPSDSTALSRKLDKLKAEMERYGHRRKPRFKGIGIERVQESEKMDYGDIKKWKSRKDGKGRSREKQKSLFQSPSIGIKSTFDLMDSVGGNQSFTPYKKAAKNKKRSTASKGPM